jgi:hypothetical protein
LLLDLLETAIVILAFALVMQYHSLPQHMLTRRTARNDALNAPPVTGDTTIVTEKAIGSNYQAFMKDLGKMSLADQPSTGAARRVEDQMPEVPFGTTAKEATSSGKSKVK